MVNVNLKNALGRAIASANRFFPDESKAWEEHFNREYATIILLEAVKFMQTRKPESKELTSAMLKHFGVR